MATDKDQIERVNNLIAILKDLQGGVPEDSGLLLKNIGVRFAKLQSEAEALLAEMTGVDLKAQESASTSPTGAAGQTTVYISLFQADAENIIQWEKTLKRIGEYSLSRPIYRKVEHVAQMIRTRPDPRKEAYAAVSVADESIIRGYAGKKETDVNGNEILTLKEGAMKSSNIQQFVHGDEVFAFRDEKLVPQQPENPNT